MEMTWPELSPHKLDFSRTSLLSPCPTPSLQDLSPRNWVMPPSFAESGCTTTSSLVISPISSRTCPSWKSLRFTTTISLETCQMAFATFLPMSNTISRPLPVTVTVPSPAAQRAVPSATRFSTLKRMNTRSFYSFFRS